MKPFPRPGAWCVLRFPDDGSEALAVHFKTCGATPQDGDLREIQTPADEIDASRIIGSTHAIVHVVHIDNDPKRGPRHQHGHTATSWLANQSLLRKPTYAELEETLIARRSPASKVVAMKNEWVSDEPTDEELAEMFPAVSAETEGVIEQPDE